VDRAHRGERGGGRSRFAGKKKVSLSGTEDPGEHVRAIRSGGAQVGANNCSKGIKHIFAWGIPTRIMEGVFPGE